MLAHLRVDLFCMYCMLLSLYHSIRGPSQWSQVVKRQPASMELNVMREQISCGQSDASAVLCSGPTGPVAYEMITPLPAKHL